MHITLKVVGGTAVGRRISVKRGQVAQFGRTEWADYSFPQDAGMADVHFVVESFEQAWRLRDLTGADQTLVNGESVADAMLHTGDEIRAGQTIFAVLVDGEAPPAGRSGAGGAGDDAAAPAVPPESLAGFYCARFELEPPAQALLQPNQTPEEFLAVLRQNQLLRDAVRFYAHWLPKRHAVWWACQCVRRVAGSPLADADAKSVTAAEQWATEPSEENRRRAESAAEALGFKTAASWLSGAAFWSGGSLAPAGLPEVPPADHLTGVAVSAALLLAAAPTPPLRVLGVFETFIALAAEVKAGRGLWPEG